MPELKELVDRLAGTNQRRILTRDEERNAAIAWQTNQDESARSLIIQSHVKTVAKEVRRMQFYKADVADLFSEGMIGLTIALDRFEPDAGFRFYTYAIHWIRAKMGAHVMLTEGAMRLSSSGKQKKLFFSYRKVMAMVQKKAQKEGREMSHVEMMESTAEALRVAPEDIQLIQSVFANVRSFDAPVGGEGDDVFTLGDILADEAPRAEDIVNVHQRSERMRSDIVSALAKLNAREQQIIMTRKLAPENEQKTLEDLSQIYNVSRERIRQLEVKALQKLERSLAPTRQLLMAA